MDNKVKTNDDVTNTEKQNEVSQVEPEKIAKTKKGNSNNMLVKVGREAMKRHNLKAVYVTTDGQSFAQKSDANAHARNLENKEVITVK